MAEKVVGIMGGMGPEAGADLFLKIMAATPARGDQEHLHVILNSYPKTPPRTEALLEGGEDPTPFLQRNARLLAQAGAEVLVIACNTAHYFYDRILEVVQIPVLHIADETVAEIQQRLPSARAVGVMGSTATVRLGLYQQRIEAKGLRAITPSDEDQKIVQAAIRAVKAGDKGPAVRERVRKVGETLVAQGAEVLITGCTELPLILQDGEASVPVVDPTEALARAAVRFARGKS